jgi:hypothetical protein
VVNSSGSPDGNGEVDDPIALIHDVARFPGELQPSGDDSKEYPTAEKPGGLLDQVRTSSARSAPGME